MKRKYLIPLLFALVLSSMLILLIPIDFNKYLLEKSSTLNHVDFESIAFEDLNGDGIDDVIECGGTAASVRKNGCVCRIMDENAVVSTVDQINVPGLIYGPSQAVTSDFDKDGVTEIWIASGEEGQLYLYGFEADNLSSFKYRFWLDSVYLQNNKYVLGFALNQSLDVNGDGSDELFFSIFNRFPVYPRRTYRVDVKNEEIIRSPSASVGFPCVYYTELPNGKRIFTSSTSSPGNHEDSLNLPYPDTLGYVYAFDQNLKFLFEPIFYSVYPSTTANYFSGNTLVSFQLHKNLDSSLVVHRRNFNGELIDKIVFSESGHVDRKGESEFYLATNDQIWVLDSALQITTKLDLEDRLRAIRAFDVDGDGKNEVIADIYNQEEYQIFSNNLDHVVSMKNETGPGTDFKLRQWKPGEYELVAFGKEKLIFYRYSENPYYYFQFPYYLGVFLLALLFSLKAFKYYSRSIEKRFDQEREFNRLQMLSLKNQIDPHFALNTLNSVDWMYKTGKGEKATKYMETYSRLMHQTVTSSDKISVSLYDELNFCRKFCELEKLREPEFDYEIKVDDSIDAFEISLPKQVVFTHVENAIKHGLRPKNGSKHLKIKVLPLGKSIEIKVENNGVPFKEKLTTSGTGKGLRLLEQMSRLYTSL
ncbi:MAG TPA: histidine kinase, partial [Cryomorphaceae bacterium]|nr:histidine kinase [Cryomorphaceae bacterium]